jgi:hypothetical protein
LHLLAFYAIMIKIMHYFIERTLPCAATLSTKSKNARLSLCMH